MMLRAGSHLALWIWLVLLPACSAQIVSVDLGHEFFKVALMRQGKMLQILLNTHSKRKTTSAVSFFESVRTFGDDALAHQGKAPAKVPMFFQSTLGNNYSSKDIQEDGRWWSDFGLGNKFYSYALEYDQLRGVPTFKVHGDEASQLEEVLAHLLYFCKQMAQESDDGIPLKVSDLVVTVPSDASLRTRQAVVAAGEIAGLRVLTLAHETPSFAVQRAVDFVPAEGASEVALYFNMGSRKLEVTVVRLEAKKTMVKDKFAPIVTVLGSAIDYRAGGHLMDIKIAEVMLKKFQEKFPKLAEGVAKNARALRKLLSQAQKTKAILSSNKVAPFIVESLYEDTDFQATIERPQFEEMCKDMFDVLTDPIEKALAAANVTMQDVVHVEMVGGAWRVPKVQEILNEYFEKSKGSPIKMGQHLNGEESGAMGAALMAANVSKSFRPKSITFTDITQHEYAVQVAALNGEWVKNYTVFYPKGAHLGSKMKLAVSLSEDFVVRLFEDGGLVTEYAITGLQELLENKWKDFNMSGTPKITATVPLERSGIIEVKNPVVTVEELYWVNVTRPKNVTSATDNSTSGAGASNGSEANDTTESEGSFINENENKDGEAREDAKEEARDEASEEGADPSKVDSESKADAQSGSDSDAKENASDNASSNASQTSVQEFEYVQKQKKKKHEKKLTITRKEFAPLPLTAEQISTLKQKLVDIATHEDEIKAVEGIKNEVEAAIYGSRDKLELEEMVKVSTEEQREEITKMAADLEEWLMEDGHSKADYESKLLGLQNLLSPIEERARELDARSQLDETIEATLGDVKAIRAHIEKNMTWVNATKIEDLVTKVEEFESWWSKKKASQAQLALHEAPAFIAAEVSDKASKLLKKWNDLKKTKKPKEKKPAKAGKNATADGKNGSKTAEATKPAEENLPVDAAATNEELTALREKKAAAVENEDFDLAHKLKVREQVLAKHLEKLQAQKTEL